MPGFTHSGAGTTYVPKAVISRRTAMSSTAAVLHTAMATSNAVEIVDDDKGVNAHSEDTFSEAATELHDNLTKKNINNSIANREKYFLRKSTVVQDSEEGRNNNVSTTITSKNNNTTHNNDQPDHNSSGDSIEGEVTFGFFPSTKPPPSPSLRDVGSTLVSGENIVDSNEKFTKTPIRRMKNPDKPISPSPQPISPPPVTRKQLLTEKRSSSNTTVVKDKVKKIPVLATKMTATPTISRDPRIVENDNMDRNNYYQIVDVDHNLHYTNARKESCKLQEDENDAEQDRANKQETHHTHPLSLAVNRDGRREVSTFSLAPENGTILYRDEHETALKKWKEREALNESERQKNDREITTPQIVGEYRGAEIESDNDHMPKDTKDSYDDIEICNYDTKINRRLDLNSLQEIDRIGDQQTKGLRSFDNIIFNQNRNKSKAKKAGKTKGKLITDKSNTLNGSNDEGIEELSTSSSIFSSTCSEFGTVIQMGDATMAARMKEVEEMEFAAYVEAQNEDRSVEYPTGSSHSLTTCLEHNTSLDLPILVSSMSGRMDNATTKPLSEAGLQSNEEKNEYVQPDTKMTAVCENSAPSPRKSGLTKSEMVSAAIRRMNTIHGLDNTIRADKKIRNSLSAPTTPMRLPPMNNSKQPSDISVLGRESSAFCYETASDGAGDQKRTILSPRFASFLRGRGNIGSTSSLAEARTSNQQKTEFHPVPLSPRVAITQSIQYAQKCFSHDNTLTEYSVDGYDRGIEFKDDDNIDDGSGKLRNDIAIPLLTKRLTTARLAPRVLPLKSSARNNRESKNSSGLRHAYSLDSSSVSRFPFRDLSSSRTERYPFLNHSFPSPTNEATAISSMVIPDPTSKDVNLRGRINSDFSPNKYSKKTQALNSTTSLRQPRTIEIEREDALDILACLVEQGIADWNTSTKTQDINIDSSINLHNHGAMNKVEKISDLDKTREIISSASSPPSTRTNIMTTSKEEETDEDISQILSKQKVGTNDSMNIDHYDCDSSMQDRIENLKKWIEGQDEDNNPNKRSQRQHYEEILQELITSHAYAVEMKRVSTSASTWLKSIGRGHSEGSHGNLSDDAETQDSKCTTTSKYSKGTRSCKNNSRNPAERMEILTLKATLHSTRSELAKTKEFNSMLNEELSQCRAEIGRMKSLSRSNHVNKSILDDSERSSDTSLSEARSKEFSASAITSSSKEGQPTGKIDFIHERLFQGVPSKEAREMIDSKDDLDVVALKNALDKANETIRSLHSNLCKYKVVKDGEEIDLPPVIDVPEIRRNEIQSRSITSTPDSTHRTVNVHMLDGENFVTEWDVLRTLPPPPDHSLRSPIVFAILEQWTQDRSLHEALLSWMDNVMKGNDLEGLPPLTISSLDHQVRDGFTMHVLPHLLRRADVHVAIQTRTHRRTTYDMSVTVGQNKECIMEPSNKPSSSLSIEYSRRKDIKSQQQSSLLDRRDSMSGDEWGNQSEPRLSSAESVSHSAVTDTITNLPTTPQKQPGVIGDQTPVQTEYRDFSSQLRYRSGSVDTFDESSQHYRQRQNEHNFVGASSGTIMGALGGALSGLLSRNKYAVSPGRFISSQTRHRGTEFTEDSRDFSNMLPASLRAQMDLTSSPTPGSARFHRLGQLEATVSSAIDDQRQFHQEEPQPYHRVVSAPPGRIGVTFVEFRGHAMVSDVAMDSPLAGWVFPSDILIAVDEIPVSGMRVRDIVTILSDRKNRQRSMRVISSHDMNEFTMMNQVVGALNEENGEDE